MCIVVGRAVRNSPRNILLVCREEVEEEENVHRCGPWATQFAEEHTTRDRYEARSHWHFPPSLVYSSSVDICLSTYEYSSLSRNSSPAAMQGERRRVEYTRGSDRSQMVPVRAWTVVMERSTWDRITVLFERVARVTDDLFRTCRYSYSSPVLVPAARFIEKPTPGFILRNKVLRLVSYFSSEAGIQLQLRNRSPLCIQHFMT